MWIFGVASPVTLPLKSPTICPPITIKSPLETFTGPPIFAPPGTVIFLVASLNVRPLAFLVWAVSELLFTSLYESKIFFSDSELLGASCST